MIFVKWRLKFFLLYLLFYTIFSYPVGKRPGSKEENHGGKKSKSETSIDDYTECYFNKIRKTEFEKRPRSAMTSVDEECSGNLISFAELIANTDQKFTKLGAPNEAAVALARGAGEFHEFGDQNILDEISQRKICIFHRNELITLWDKSKHVKRKAKTIPCCSIPPTLPDNLNHHFLKDAVSGVVNYISAKAVLYVNGTLIHVGAARCKIHRDMIKASVSIFEQQNVAVTEKLNHEIQIDEIKTDTPSAPPLPERQAKIEAPNYKEEPMEEDICEVAEPVKSAFFALLKEMKLPQNCISKKWMHLKRRSRYNYIAVLNKVYNTAALILGGKDNHEKLKEAAVEKMQPKYVKKEQNGLQNEFLQELKLRFYKAGSTSERRSYLSLFVEVLPISVIEKYIPDINPYQYHEAKKMARRNKNNQQKPERGYKEVIKKSQVEKFVSFFTNEMFTTGIPFGRIRKRLSNKKVVELPVTVREMRDSKIIQKYKNYLAEKGEIVGMSDSTLRKILNACPAKRKISLRAVDEQKADGILAFEWMLEVIIDLENKNLIDKEQCDEYKNRLVEAEFFFRTDYYMLLTYDHHSAEALIISLWILHLAKNNNLIA